MSKKPIKRIGFRETEKTRFTDKRKTITVEEDGSIRYYDLETSLSCEGYFTQTIRCLMEYHREHDYIVCIFHGSNERHWRNFYVRRI